jgi:hypothetical protein
MKRKSRRAKGQKVFPLSGDLKLIEPDAAAVDVGSRSHWVAVNPERDPNPVREFGTFTADLTQQPQGGQPTERCAAACGAHAQQQSQRLGGKLSATNR